jgi:hypothetical protein
MVSTPGEALLVLSRCIETAQNLFPSQSVVGNAGFYLDIRRLYDSLRTESTATIFLYSPKEGKFLFVNDHVQSLLGWSSEKFIQSFSDIAKNSLNSWKQIIAANHHKEDMSATLVLTTKNGIDLIVNCHMAPVPSGTFRNLLFGILYPHF